MHTETGNFGIKDINAVGKNTKADKEYMTGQLKRDRKALQ